MKRLVAWISFLCLVCFLTQGLVIGSCFAAQNIEVQSDEQQKKETIVDATNDVELIGVGDTIGDPIDLIEQNETKADAQASVSVGPQKISEESLVNSLAKFEQSVKFGFVPSKALPEGDIGNATALVYQPPLQSLYLDSTGEINDPSTQVILALYEILLNPQVYALDDLLNQVAYIAGFPQFDAAFQMELVKIGLPDVNDAVVRAWQTDFVVGLTQELLKSLNEDGLETFRKAFPPLEEGTSKLFRAPKADEEIQKNMISLLVDLVVGLLEDPDSVVWADLTVILGDPLGPALIPALKSPIIAGALNDTDGIKERAFERQDELMSALSVLAGKNILFNPFFPSPCVDPNSINCSLGYSDENTTQSNEFATLYRQAKSGEIDDLEFGDTFNEKFLNLFLTELGLKDIYSLVRQSLYSENVAEILEILSKPGDIDDEEVTFLHSMQVGNVSIAIDEGSLNADGFNDRAKPAPPLASLRYLPSEKREHLFSPQAMLCLANVSALMYEYPETKKKWASGLGLKSVSSRNVGSSFSSIYQIFTDVHDNAIVLAFEGTPYMNINFFRGVYGWLQDLLSSEQVPFEYPCEDTVEPNDVIDQQEAADAKAMCTALASKYPNAKAYRGFLPQQEVAIVKKKLIGALDEALAELKKEDVPAKEKPKLYITGHSLGAAIAKSALVQLLLRRYDLNFASVEAYTFAPPTIGDPEYISMINELLNITGGEEWLVINQYDYIPYLPPFINFTHGDGTLFIDHQDALLKQVDLKDVPFESQPINVFMPPLGYHSIKGQYLPLARALPGNMYTEQDAQMTVASSCELSCDVGQCGLFKCPDRCLGML